MEEYMFAEEKMKEIDSYLHQNRVDEWGEGYPKVVTFIPLERTVSYADLVLPHIVGHAQRGNHFIWSEYGAVAITRNKAAFQLLDSDFTHILMLDLDHAHPMDITEQLVRWVVADPSIKVIGGLNYGRRPPYKPCASLETDVPGEHLVPTVWEPGTIMEVNMLGTGSILIDRTVFEDIEPIWFENDFSGWASGNYAGEDTVFSRKCQEAGIKLWVVPDLTSPHIDYHTIGRETFKSWYSLHGMSTEGER